MLEASFLLVKTHLPKIATSAHHTILTIYTNVPGYSVYCKQVWSTGGKSCTQETSQKLRGSCKRY